MQLSLHMNIMGATRSLVLMWKWHKAVCDKLFGYELKGGEDMEFNAIMNAVASGKG